MNEKLVINEGLVCFFDILGYKNIIDNNDIMVTIDIIKNILRRIPKAVIKRHHNAHNHIIKESDKFFFKYLLNGHPIVFLKHIINRNSTKKRFLKLLKSYFNILFVSDSIILFFDINNMKNSDKCYNIMLVLFYIKEFFYSCFFLGLPMRGCIDIGTFYYNDNIFAGDTITRSYNQSESLNFSGIVLTEKFHDYLFDLYSNNEKINGGGPVSSILYDDISIQDVWVKQNNNEYNREKKYLLNWLGELTKEYTSELDKAIDKVFCDYNKNTKNPSVIAKIINTKEIIKIFIEDNVIGYYENKIIRIPKKFTQKVAVDTQL
jgi:hypothetical protein